MSREREVIFGFFIVVTSIYSQNTENLTSDQKKEYNRRKLTVEKVTESSSNMGWYWGIFAKRVDTWRAFKGLANLIEPEEFFRITGYKEEAKKVKENVENANSKITGGWILYFAGLFGVNYYTEETSTEDFGFGYELETTEISFPLLVPGLIAGFGGLYLAYDGMLNKLKPIAPYQSASDIAEEYNKNIIAEITK